MSSGGIKRGKDVTLGWGELMPKTLTRIKPKGYSTVREISKKLDLSVTETHRKLKDLRENHKIDCIQIRNEDGKNIWIYKD